MRKRHSFDSVEEIARANRTCWTGAVVELTKTKLRFIAKILVRLLFFHPIFFFISSMKIIGAKWFGVTLNACRPFANRSPRFSLSLNNNWMPFAFDFVWKQKWKKTPNQIKYLLRCGQFESNANVFFFVQEVVVRAEVTFRATFNCGGGAWHFVWCGRPRHLRHSEKPTKS